MQFELTQALMDDILSYMEDQHGEFLLDTQELTVLNVDDENFDKYAFEADASRFITLPEWGPHEGFRLMEHFTAGIHNALARQELSSALNRGRGVFRAFKDALAFYPDVEKLWFAYKDREMKREVTAWYNGLREEWVLELIGEEPEDINYLTLEDFHFREGQEQDKPIAQELHYKCQSEFGTQFNAKIDAIFAGMDDWVFPGDVSFVAETGEGGFAGYISAVRHNTALRICATEIVSEYRGLGLGKALVARLVEKADHEKIPQVIIDLPAGQEHFARVLLRESFKPGVQRYCR